MLISLIENIKQLNTKQKLIFLQHNLKKILMKLFSRVGIDYKNVYSLTE